MSSLSVQRGSPSFCCNCCLSKLTLFVVASTTDPRTGKTSSFKQYLTDCYHILCQNCRMKCVHNCAACHRKCQFMEISRKMPKRYQWYFDRISSIQQYLGNVLKFQRCQSAHVTDKLIAAGKHYEKRCINEINIAKVAKKKQQMAAHKLRQISTIFEKICQEKRRQRLKHHRNSTYKRTVTNYRANDVQFLQADQESTLNFRPVSSFDQSPQIT